MALVIIVLSRVHSISMPCSQPCKKRGNIIVDCRVYYMTRLSVAHKHILLAHAHLYGCCIHIYIHSAFTRRFIGVVASIYWLILFRRARVVNDAGHLNCSCCYQRFKNFVVLFSWR